jgi:hypothetical protein
MDLVSAFDVGGSLAIFQPAVKRLYIIVKRGKFERETRERLRYVIPAMEALEAAFNTLQVRGGAVRGIIMAAPVPCDVTSANNLYIESAGAVGEVAVIFRTFRAFAFQASQAAKLEEFMADVKRADPRVYDGVRLLERSYQNDDKVDLTGFPAYLRAYPPKGTADEQTAKAVVDAAMPVLEKAMKVIDTLPRPFRARVVAINKQMKVLMDETQHFVWSGDKVIEYFSDLSPDWMQALGNAAHRAMVGPTS